jgi:hypothetical protein
VLFLVIVSAYGCNKGSQAKSETTRNGVNISLATATFNSYRTKGFQNLPATTAIVWNDTLSDAAFKFAHDIATQGDGPGGNVYITGQGEVILNYPGNLGYSGNVAVAFCYLFSDTANIKNMIDQGFSAYPNFSTFTDEIMNSMVTKFGMGEYNNRWYLIAGN